MIVMTNTKTYVLILGASLLLFCFRVSAQLLQVIIPVDFLPPFASWQSGALPYEILLPIQIIMIILMAKHVWLFNANKIIPNKK